MKSKECIKCGLKKPITHFYKHKGMGDGYLNKCKDCVKSYSKESYHDNKKSDEWYSKELNRQRIKNRDSDKLKKYYLRYPEKYEAKLAAQYMLPPVAEYERHHWSYNAIHYKDVIWLSKKNHAKAHRFIIYDQERRLYRKCDNGELLDTRELHESFIGWCIKNKEG